MRFNLFNFIRPKWFIGVMLIVPVGVLAPVGMTQSQTVAQSSNSSAKGVLFENVRIFNGTSEKLSATSNVLVVGNKIQMIATTAIAAPSGVTRINGGGRVLMPGLIDNHTHLVMATSKMEDLAKPNLTLADLTPKAQKNATEMLMRGFTSARDMAGPIFETKKAIDWGDVAGPRIWPAGAMISQTSGHADYRSLSELPRTPTSPLNWAEKLGFGAIADGEAEVLRRTREQLMRGATQIKLAAGGGVASDYDPLDVSEYTEAELKAAVDAAANWNTYVTVHAYTPTAIQAAIRAGVKCIEHGQLMDEKTAQIMAEKASGSACNRSWMMKMQCPSQKAPSTAPNSCKWCREPTRPTV